MRVTRTDTKKQHIEVNSIAIGACFLHMNDNSIRIKTDKVNDSGQHLCVNLMSGVTHWNRTNMCIPFDGELFVKPTDQAD